MTINRVIICFTLICVTTNILGQNKEDDTSSKINSEKIELPPYLMICYRDAPNDERNECLKESINRLLPKLKDGYPPLGIPSIEPYIHNRTRVENNAGILNVKLNLRNIYVGGISKVRVDNVKSKVNDKNLYIEFQAKFPVLTLAAEYKGNAKLNDVQVKSKGVFNSSTYGLSVKYGVLGKTITKNNIEYIVVRQLKQDIIDIEDMKLNMTGLFPDPDVNTFAIQFLNQNWRELYGALVPSVKAIWSDVVITIANKIFENVPYDQIMPKK